MQRLHALGVDDIASDIRKLDNGPMKTAGSKEGHDPLEARHWYDKGRCFLRMGKHDDAIDCFDRSLRVDPSLTPSWLGKSMSLQLLRRYGEAIPCFDQALALEPRHADAWFN
jgi:tetratricopeptide (TPR) repeat protein